MATITAGQAISAALSNIEPGWRGAWGALAVGVALAAVNQLAGPGLSLLIGLASLVVGTMANGALYRLQLQPDHPGDPAFQPGKAGFQWTGFEGRILLANVVLFFIGAGAAIAGFLVWCVLLGIMVGTHLLDPNLLSNMNAVSDPWAKLALFFSGVGGVVNILLLLAAAVGFVWLIARLALVAINAAAAGRLDIGGGWALTRGVAWPIAATFIVVVLICGVAGGVLGLAGAIIGKGAAAMLGAMVGQAIAGPASAGLAGYVYRAKHGPNPAIAQVFA